MKWIHVILSALVITASIWAADPNHAGPKSDQPQIEVVFVLDTTGSMGGLIKAAKEKIWSIANTMATADPAPQIKIGLVGYRDRGDEYITQMTGLDQDLDKVYGKLMLFQAGGGGDGPESVNQALHEAVTKIKWTAGDSIYRVIFLVGDFPPHMDYDNDIHYPDTCKLAAERGIVVNTILCGNNKDTHKIWNEIAKKAEGRYFQVEQSGSAILIDTPFDNEIADWSRRLDSTRIYYGLAGMQLQMRERAKDSETFYYKADTSAIAQRAAFNSSIAGKDNFRGSQELLGALMDGKIDLDKLSESEMPEEMKKLNDEERKAYIEKKTAEREEATARIKDLSEKRQAFIQKIMDEKKLDKKSSLEYQLFECIRSQAAKAGIKYNDVGPQM